jgi:hypothetical protein
MATEADLNAPDLDEDGNLDVEHYPVPDGRAIRDPYLRGVWDDAVQSLDVGVDPTTSRILPQEK